MDIVLKVGGMSCMHCVARVKKALEAVPGVTSADVSLEKGEATVRGACDIDTAVKAVVDAGYDCTK